MFDTSLNEKNLAHQVELVLDQVRIVLGAHIFVQILFKGSTLGPVRAMYDIETFTEWLSLVIMTYHSLLPVIICQL